jgi:LmbE family N-acetylglucosaminyl deacetylase
MFWGLFLGALVGGYYWQPLRYEFFPPEPPEAARVTPESVGLFESGKRVLIVAGHPDDSEFYLGGTLLKMARAGARVRLVCMTDGDKAFYPFGVPEGLTETRRGEQTRAAREWNGDVVFLGYKDGRLPVNDDTVADIVEQIERFRPDVILSIDVQYRPRRSHSDHIDSGRNALLAIERMGWTGTLGLYNSRAPNCFIDVTADWFGKMELIAIHESQFGGSKNGFIGGMLTRRAQEAGQEAGFPLAEALRIIEP